MSQRQVIHAAGRCLGRGRWIQAPDRAAWVLAGVKTADELADLVEPSKLGLPGHSR